MAQTKQGPFEMVYCHIDPPTKTDDIWGAEHKSRKLYVPTIGSGDIGMYRDPLLYELSQAGWCFKRKLDGQNMRVRWDGEQALWNGKSDKFSCGSDLSDYMNHTFLEELFEEKFGRDCEVYLFGEHMGPKVQGNELGLQESEFVLFDVRINGYWQSQFSIEDIARFFKIHTCYDFMGDLDEYSTTGTLIELINAVEQGKFKDWEGIVALPQVECRNQRGDRIVCKIKTRDYYKEG